MDFRRLPFQFSTTDPAKRQEELRKRFGLPANTDKMYLDLANPGTMGAKAENSHSASSSPRFQHRVPIFVEGSSEPVKPSVGTQNVDASRKPHVRIIPIEVEGATDPTRRHRTLSGPAECARKGRENGITEHTKHPVADPPTKLPKEPRICNIPIKIEGGGETKKPKSPLKTPKVKSPTVAKENGCSVSKVADVPEKRPSSKQVALEKIEGILERLKGYHVDVEQFIGTDKDKKYKYLDEMLTRCMLELDGIDTMGIEAIRLSRKNAVKKVQASIDLLETNVTRSTPEISAGGPMEVESSSNENLDVSESIVESKEVKIDAIEKSASDGVEANALDIEAEDQPLQSSEMDVDPKVNIDVHENGQSSGIKSISDDGVVNMIESVSDKVEANASDNIDTEVSDQSSQLTEPDAGVKLEIDVKDDGTVSDEVNMGNVSAERKIDLKVTDNQPVQITEMDTDIGNASTVETEPVVEEPLSDSIEMDPPSHGSLSDANSIDSCSFKVCEVKDEKPEAELCARTEDAGVSNIPTEVKQHFSTLIPDTVNSSTARETSAELETEVKCETSVPELSAVDKSDCNPLSCS